MSTVRTFAAGDKVQFDLGNTDLNGVGMSLLLLWKPTTVGVFPELLVWKNASSVSQYYWIGLSSDKMEWHFNVDSDSTSTLAVNKWHLLGVSKPSGAAQTVTFHFKNLTDNTAWVHESGSATIDNPGSMTLPGSLYLGGGGLAGDVGCAAVWKSNLSNANYESITSLSAISSLSPNGYWILDQASTATSVSDETGGGANQAALTGTSVSTGVTIPNFTFDRNAGTATGFLLVGVNSP